MSANTSDLLDVARTGAKQERGALLERYRNYLELLAQVELGCRLQCKVDTSDVVQETFLEAHRKFDRFRGTSEPQFVGWLREILLSRIAVVMRHYIGTKGRDVRREHSMAVDFSQSSAAIDQGLLAISSTPSQEAMRREQGVLLADALARLPEHYREVLVLRHLEDLTFPEVAQRMNRTVYSVKKVWGRAVPMLRQLLRDMT
ncbi:MAG: sigma-70 family RNA polymerase sigma factor [Planctomycetaceae bacterium]